MLHLIIDTLGAALFFICYGYAMLQEPWPRADDDGGPRDGHRRRLTSTAFAAEAALISAR